MLAGRKGPASTHVFTMLPECSVGVITLTLHCSNVVTMFCVNWEEGRAHFLCGIAKVSELQFTLIIAEPSIDASPPSATAFSVTALSKVGNAERNSINYKNAAVQSSPVLQSFSSGDEKRKRNTDPNIYDVQRVRGLFKMYAATAPAV